MEFMLQFTENGQLNKSMVAEEMAEAKDNNERAEIQSFYHELDEDLKANATEKCSAGAVIQEYLYLEVEEDQEDGGK